MRMHEPRYRLGLLVLAAAIFSIAASGVQSASLEAASLQLGALQSQAQYPPAALQGARTASRSAASCLVTAVQYTHGQQIWRADPCEFCLCLDGEMFCWWQECPPEARGPCPTGQPYSLCGNSSSSFDKRPAPTPHKIKKVPIRKISSTSATSSEPATPTSQPRTTATPEAGVPDGDKKVSKIKDKFASKADKKYKEIKEKLPPYVNFNSTDGAANQTSPLDDGTKLLFNNDTSKVMDSSRNLESAPSQQSLPSTKAGCLVMGVLYQIGEALPSTGSCLACQCSDGGNGGAKVSCAPRGCAPMDSATLTDDPESF